MSSTHGPSPEDDVNEENESKDRESEDRESEDRENKKPASYEPTIDIKALIEVLDAQAGSLCSAIQSAQEVAEPGAEIPLSEVDSVRTEVIEFQAVAEELLTQHCKAATPWEYAGEHIPEENLNKFVGGT